MNIVWHPHRFFPRKSVLPCISGSNHTQWYHSSRRPPALPSNSAYHNRRGFVTSTSRQTAADANTNIHIGHSRFLAEAAPGSKWKDSDAALSDERETDSVKDGKGKLSPTSSHLFKLILPLSKFSHPQSDPDTAKAHFKDTKPSPPTVILLHPSQPLSHISSLIIASLAPWSAKTPTPTISFRNVSSAGQIFQWSDSTDVGDFIKDAAKTAKFSIYVTYKGLSEASSSSDTNTKFQQTQASNSDDQEHTVVIDIEVPTFADRTRFLRRRLSMIQAQLDKMEGLKLECDREAHRGAKRMAMGGFGILVVYWGAVARLTFWDYGWDVMEPITYLSGLSTVVCGYLWFLYQGREVSYSSVLNRSISTRREALYKSRGLDIDLWMDLISDKRSVRREIGRIAEDYDHEGKDEDEDDRPKRESDDSVVPPQTRDDDRSKSGKN